jgi:hypothetical protein
MSTGQSVSAEFQEHAAANPARQVVDSVAECLSYAATWHAWDGRPIARCWVLPPLAVPGAAGGSCPGTPSRAGRVCRPGGIG